MGYDLFGGEDKMSIQSWYWPVLLDIAENNGWKPEGTKAPDPQLWSEGLLEQAPKPNEDWCGSYCSNDWQEVSATDALNLANALGKAVEYFKTGEHDQELLKAFWYDELLEGRKVPDAVEFREDSIGFFEKFIRFCDGAPFVIG